MAVSSCELPSALAAKRYPIRASEREQHIDRAKNRCRCFALPREGARRSPGTSAAPPATRGTCRGVLVSVGPPLLGGTPSARVGRPSFAGSERPATWRKGFSGFRLLGGAATRPQLAFFGPASRRGA